MVSWEGVGGAVAGLSVQLMSNALRKHKLRRHPWEHLICMGVGYYFMDGFARWADQLDAQTDLSLEQRARLRGQHVPSK